ncbi:hypothetical protein [Streptomyces sp. NPDC058411]|uniref:hypothetical protein n=1 Tax=Streptomyces sp. NPDC058411 TaxID=3346485 RepID=UPI00365932DC
MANSGDNEDGNKSEDTPSWVWLIPGAAIGLSLALKYVYSLGYDKDDTLPWSQGIIMLALGFGPAILLAWISEQLAKEVLAEKSTWATYWTTMVAITAPALALAGVTSFDDLLKLWNSQ